ncbi:Transcriptional regulatory protein FixJ [Pirellulimonas nuda]|uniref:Transcriptional regulatory protein FixJ n=2 Tax=Pirellulimonas nuda TaxID=2528009 RepID=A0A518D9E9_9BACT|nr:Transcriptional regulatory protein FixJ [Pirellulimonas nuda]
MLQVQGRELPSVLVTGFATTQLAVRAMRNGAITVLDKPPSDSSLRQAVVEALHTDSQRLASETIRSSAQAKIDRLSPSERQVLEMVLEGMPNKQIAGKLGVCVRTVEARRSRIYQSTDVGSVAELVRLSIAAGLVDVC